MKFAHVIDDTIVSLVEAVNLEQAAAYGCTTQVPDHVAYGYVLSNGEWVDPQAEQKRLNAIDARVREVKNASLGYGPNQTGDTLRTQVNLAIGGLLKMHQQQKVAMATLLIGSNICSAEQFEAAFQTALTSEEHTAIAKRLAYYAWINQVDAHAAALKADPDLPENFPPAPEL